MELTIEQLAVKQKRQREWVAARRAQWFKANGSCTKCGSWDRLEVDHINPLEKTSHKVFSWCKEKRELELSKCQVLCYFCHKQKTKVDMQVFFEKETHHIHGTNTEYRRGCRCEPCRKAKYEEGKAYKLRSSTPKLGHIGPRGGSGQVHHKLDIPYGPDIVFDSMDLE